MMMLSMMLFFLFLRLDNLQVLGASQPLVTGDLVEHRRQDSSNPSMFDIFAINAQRIANGLPPLPPAGFFGPTRVSALADPSRLPSSSTSPSSTSSSLPSTSSLSLSPTSSLSLSSSSSSSLSSFSSLFSSLASSTLSSSSSASESGLGSSSLSSSPSLSSSSTLPSPSPSPARVSNAFIRVLNASNSHDLGYLAPPKRGGFFLSIAREDEVRLQFSFLPVESNFNISILSSTYPNLGFSSSTTSLTSNPYMPIVSTNPTGPGSVALKVGNPMSGIRWDYSQSSIWSYNAQTKQLQAHWVNPDRSTPPTLFWYNTGFNAITIIPSPPGNEARGYELRLFVEN